MPKFAEGLLVAFVTGAAAVGGAWVGGYMSSRSAEKVESRQTRLEDARRADAAHAVDRLLIVEYQRDAKRLEEMIGERLYIPGFYRQRIFVSRIGLEDRKLLAGELSWQDWLLVANATNAVEEVETALEAHDGRGKIDAEDLETLEEASAACTKAFYALSALTES